MVIRKKDGLIVDGLTKRTALTVSGALKDAGVNVGIYYGSNEYTLIVNATLKALRNNPMYIKNVNYKGNKKLVNNDDVKYIIWSIPAKKTCPNATKMCILSCYADKAERMYPNVKKSRKQAFEISQQDNFTDRMIYTLMVEIYCTNKYNNVKQIRYRIHESGDFYNQTYTDKWMGIIKYMQFDRRIVFDLYTKSLLYFEKYNAIDGIFGYENIAFKASVWADTPEKMLALIKKHGYRVYTADTPENIAKVINSNKRASMCGCSDCGNCGMCVDNNIKLLLCAIH